MKLARAPLQAPLVLVGSLTLSAAVAVACSSGGGTATSTGSGGSEQSSSSASSGATGGASVSTAASTSGSGATASSGAGGGDAGDFKGNTGSLCDPVPAGGDLTKGPFAAPPAVAGVSFLTDWKGLAASGGYRYTQIMDGCRMQLDGTQTWHGLPALRVEVKPGDDPLGLGSERAEALTMQDGSGSIFENTQSGTQYYATSYYFPSTWDGTFLQGDGESWSFVFQLYGASALSAGRHQAPGPQVYQLFLGPPGGNDQEYDLSSGALALGLWTDLVFMYTWATTPTGHVTAWRRDQGQAKFQQVLDVASVVTLPSSDATSYYWKQGLYRGPHVNGRTDVLWIGPTARGSSFAAVEQATFGTSNGP